MEIKYVLPMRVGFKHVDDFDTVQNEVKKSVDSCALDYEQRWGKTHKLSSSWSTDCVITRYEMITLEREIYNCVKSFIGTDFDYTLNSWLAVYDTGDYSHTHHHYPSTFSGVYCYDTSVESNNNFYFTDDYDNQHMQLNVGDLLVFPSYIKHGVKSNTSDKRRISLAFNLSIVQEEFLRLR